MIDSTQLEFWYASPKGDYVLNAQLALIRNMVASWKRRDHLLLEIGTGAGHTLTTLWECGFDVTGVDDSPLMLSKAQERLGHKATLHLHNLEYLPYDDNTFDYVVLSSILLTQHPIQPLLDEALRLSSKGILLFVKNSLSCHGIFNSAVSIQEKQALRLQQYSPFYLWRYLRTHCPQKTWKVRSILLGPSFTWRHVPYFLAFNAIPSPFPLGSFICLRIDKGVTIPLTGTPLSVRNQGLVGACSQD